MGPTLRPFAYRRDPWWDPNGRVSRRRRRRRLMAWGLLVAVAVALGGLAGEARAVGGAGGGPAHVSVTEAAGAR